MKSDSRVQTRIGLALVLGFLAIGTLPLFAQSIPFERVFPQPASKVEDALRTMKANLSGRLPVLDGFANPDEHPLSQYQRGYYQANVTVVPNPSGGSLVRINLRLTAWYDDPTPSHSGYRLLTSNGRLESDIFDQLADQLGSHDSRVASTNPSRPNPPVESTPPPAASSASTTTSAAERATPSSQPPASPQVGGAFSSSLNQSLSAEEKASVQDVRESAADKKNDQLRAEAQTLEETLKNQVHPKNLVAVKKSGTPVVASASLTGKTLFLASMHDEFEMLDFNRDWVHVRISGLSRGWIWRDSVEMPDGISETAVHSATPPRPTAADLFHVVREETAQFPGDWQPLRGKNVKILSIQKVDETKPDSGPGERLEYAKFLLDQSYSAMAQKPQQLAGIVLIFDSVDGGMIAATLPTLQQWKSGALSDAALWHQCFFDPPEATLESAGPSGSR
ncbi:MAG TPA: hypothetical protein VMG31_09395 [Verrucomicrobiae bacterium]|nr:hypothetical protein [Verrucomicrobiae bacterium]